MQVSDLKKTPVIIKNDNMAYTFVQIKDKGSIQDGNTVFLPADGEKFAYLVGTIENISETSQLVRLYHVYIRYKQGDIVHDVPIAIRWSDGTINAGPLLNPGEKMRFYICYSIPKKVDKFEIVIYRVGNQEVQANQIPRKLKKHFRR